MKYCVLYPEAENVHLIKDVGIIAYKLHKLFGYNAYVACYKNGEYPYVNDELKGLKLDFIEKTSKNDIFNGIKYLKKNAKEIEALQLFHVTLRTVFYTFAFKFFNPKGKIFLKLDCTERLVSLIAAMNPIKRKILNIFLNKVDLIGVEQAKLYNELKELLKKQREKLIYIPNGIDFDRKDTYSNLSYEEKENIILHVGRIGSEEKCNDNIMEAFSKIKNNGWKLVFVGPIEESFNKYIENFYIKNPQLKEKVVFKGPIYDRDKLYCEYKKAKVFCLASKYESFAIALLEAASFGDVIVSTDVGIASELTSLKNGIIVENNSIENLVKAFDALTNTDNLFNMSEETKKICRNRFDLNKIVTNLHSNLQNLR